jgi:hypothetical protein
MYDLELPRQTELTKSEFVPSDTADGPRGFYELAYNNESNI